MRILIHLLRSRSFAALVALSVSVASAHAEIRYTVKPLTEVGRLQIAISFDAGPGELQLQIPNWGPGSYRLVDNFRNVQDFKAEVGGGVALDPGKPNDHTWTLSVPKRSGVTVSYTMPSAMQGGAIHYSGPATYMYVAGRKEEACRLTLDVPEGWKIAVGLDEARGAKNTYIARDYDTLADNPVTMGDFIVDFYFSRGKPHTIAYRGAAASGIDREYVKKVCKFISDSQADFFGGLPFSKYVWHFNVTPSRDGGGGLEHLSSTQITLAQGVGPRSVHVCAHEFFHLWNVKRIRSKPLGPFDYTQLPQTGALWFLEGVTDYYASLLQFRYGWWQEEEFFDHIESNVRGVRGNAARMQVSPYEASMRVREAANGRGNSNGYLVSYYNTGWLVGLCLDTEIRFQSKGKHSLDDVVRALYETCKDGKPGFEEDEIRKLCVRFGGPSLGTFYDQVVMSPGELPVEAQLEKMGLRLSERMEFTVDPGFDWQLNPQSREVRVTRVREGSALQVNDVILETNGKSLAGSSAADVSRAATDAIGELKADLEATLKIKRGSETIEVRVKPAQRSRSALKVDHLAGVSAATRELREGWYFAGKRRPETVENPRG